VRRKQISDLLAKAKQAANANQFALHFHQATTILDEVVATTEAEFKKYPDDRGFHEIWLQALSSAAEAREKEGEVATAADSLSLLSASSQKFSQNIAEYKRSGTPVACRSFWVLGQHCLALIEEKTRALDQAVPLDGWQLPVCYCN
jgi:hypothetical protein